MYIYNNNNQNLLNDDLLASQIKMQIKKLNFKSKYKPLQNYKTLLEIDFQNVRNNHKYR